jgi:hypothetical protein
MNDEFYIGWQDKAPALASARIRRVVMLLVTVALISCALFALAQRTIGVSAFEWGKVKEFSGILKAEPYPHLLVPRPGAHEGTHRFSSYYLVKPFKLGLGPEAATQFNNQPVTLRGTLIYRGNQTMIEVERGSVTSVTRSTADKTEALRVTNSRSDVASLGEQTLIGEIVDSKCFLGVMNPGALTPHRACAIRCISGGIPPVLLVRQTNGTALYFLLVSRDGKPVNKEVLNLVAEPVSITGEVERQGEMLVLRADPSTYRRW